MEIKKETGGKELTGQETEKIKKLAELAKESPKGQREMTGRDADRLLERRLEGEKPEVSEDLNGKTSRVTFDRMGPCERKCANEKHETGFRY